MWLSQGLNQGLQIGPAILDKSAWDSVAVVSVISWCPLKTVKLFQKCLAGLPPAGLKSNLICGLWWGVEGGGGWAGMCDFKEASQIQICPKVLSN